MKFSADSVSKGTAARVAGLILLLGLPVGFLAHMFLAVRAAHGAPPLFSETVTALLTYIILGVSLILALIVAKTGTVPVAKA